MIPGRDCTNRMASSSVPGVSMACSPSTTWRVGSAAGFRPSTMISSAAAPSGSHTLTGRSGTSVSSTRYGLVTLAL